MSISEKRVKVTRDKVLLVCGLFGIAYEAYNRLERPALLLLYAGMIGLPAVFAKDERNQAKKDGTNNGSGETDVH